MWKKREGLGVHSALELPFHVPAQLLKRTIREGFKNSFRVGPHTFRTKSVRIRL